MKRLLFPVLLLMLLSLAACGGPESPVEVVEAFIQATVDGDADAMDDLVCAEELALAKERVRLLREQGVTMEVEASYTLKYEKETKAKVVVDGTMTMTDEAGKTEHEDFTETLKLIKEDGRWKFCD